MSNHAPRVVAVVEDDAGVRASLRFLLETAGHAVETYESGARFLADAEPGRLACLVLNQQMPQIAGLDLLARLRSQGFTTPVLLIVSTPAPEINRRAAQLGAHGVLEKPLAQDDLLAQVEAAIG